MRRDGVKVARKPRKPGTDARTKVEIRAQAHYAFGRGDDATVALDCRVDRADGGSWVQVWHWVPADPDECVGGAE